MDIQSFKNAYSNCVKQSDKHPSESFKNFVNNLLPEKYSENPLRAAMVTGYFLRCAESAAQQSPLGEPSQEIQKIIDSNRSKEEKIKAIANHLDNHNRIGLSDEIANHSLIPFQETQKFFEIYAEDYISQTLKKMKWSKEKIETFNELAYRNMAFGYLYKLSEKLVESSYG